LKAAKDQGLKVVMLTYTFQHSRADALTPMLEAMAGAFESYRGGRQAMRRRQRYGVVGSVRALEVTHSETNGWHPHVHELVFLAGEADVAMFAAESRRAWERAAAKHGLAMNEHGFRCDDCDQRVADYVAKFGHEPSAGGWDESTELTKWHMKRGREPQRGHDEHVTPFGLLGYAAEGDARAGALFREYALAFKGRRQLFWSPDLRQMLDMGKEKTDEEVAGEQEQQGVELVVLNRESWRIVLGNDCRGELLAVARTGDVQQVFVFLEAIGVTQYAFAVDDAA